jgi:PilZ domain
VRQGAAHVFQKPFRLQELADVLHGVLRDPERSLPGHEGMPAAVPRSQERRKYPRIAGRPVGVLLAGDELATEPVHGVVVNYSIEGLCVLVEHAAEPGTTLFVRPAEPSVLAVWAPVEIQYQRTYDHRWVLGCRFVDAPAPNMLQLYA